MALRLDTSIQYLKGVGPKLGALFERQGIHTIQDLLEFYPRTYEDQRAARSISTLKANEVVGLKVQVVSVYSINMGRSARKMYDVLVKDQSGRIHCKFFRVPYKGYFDRLAPGKTVRVVGKVTDYRGRLEFHHPDLREIETEKDLEDTLIPIYIEVEGLSSSKIHKLILKAISELNETEKTKKGSGWGVDLFSDEFLKRNKLLTRQQAFVGIHQPDPDRTQEYMNFRSPEQRRLIFEEFFKMEMILASRRAGVQKQKGLPITSSGQKVKQLIEKLPFKLTTAQLTVYEEIQRDLNKPQPMQRLVQGDVGSGKTIVSFLSVVYAVESGFQCTLMAPTEILAEQHYKNALYFLSDLGVRVGFLAGKTKTSERRVLSEKLMSGEVDFLIGTHALIEDDVQFKNLGLLIIDEQHRFGVEQRSLLRAKGHNPHMLVMTATPIPRTLAMTVYGDLDVSIINQLPEGRTPIQTRVATETKRNMAFDFMVEHIKLGRQAYVVYPLVEESEKIDLKNAIEEFDNLQKRYPDIPMGLLHGKMKPLEKEQIMNDFRSEKFKVLVSTTVIEVGVDVPNANVMIIEHAERFGLSQLHQLRGRVGRGSHKSFCILMMGYAVSDEGRQRLEFMEKSQDGFKIAEFDLEMRGPGEFLGTRQSGLPGFKLAHLVRDFEILKQSREAAFNLIAEDPKLEKEENKKLSELKELKL